MEKICYHSYKIIGLTKNGSKVKFYFVFELWFLKWAAYLVVTDVYFRRVISNEAFTDGS